MGSEQKRAASVADLNVRRGLKKSTNNDDVANVIPCTMPHWNSIGKLGVAIKYETQNRNAVMYALVALYLDERRMQGLGQTSSEMELGASHEILERERHAKNSGISRKNSALPHA